MKKIILLFVLSISLLSNAQLINGDFETVKPNFLASNWGMNYNFPAFFNPTTGQFEPLNVQYNSCISAMCNATFDAHTGNTALEITNALITANNTVAKGYARLFWNSAEDSPGWNPGVVVSPTDVVDVLSFHYKFTALGSEIAEAKLELFDIDSNVIGSAEIDILPTTGSNFSYINRPVIFTSSVTPVYMYIYVGMAKDGTDPTFGSRLVIDDVVINSALLSNNTFENNSFAVYPTLVNNEINITKSNSISGNYDFKIVNIEGRIINQKTINFTENENAKIDVSNLSKGIYFVKTDGFITKFVKQ